MIGARHVGRMLARRLSTAVGVVLLVLSYAMFTGGVALAWSDHADREGGYLWGPDVHAATSAYAVVSDDIHLDAAGVQRVVDRVTDSVRLEVTPDDPTDVLFVGVARSGDVRAYLRGVAYRQVGALGQGGTVWGWLGPGVTTNRAGQAPATAPGDAGIWLAQSTGIGTRTVAWPLADGDWAMVIMRADGGAGISVTARTGAEAPHLRSIASCMVLVALCLFAAGARLTWGTAGPVRLLPHTPTPVTREPGGFQDTSPAEVNLRTLVGR